MTKEFKYLRATKPNRSTLFIEFTDVHGGALFDLLYEQGFSVEKIEKDAFERMKAIVRGTRMTDYITITLLPEYSINLLDHYT